MRGSEARLELGQQRGGREASGTAWQKEWSYEFGFFFVFFTVRFLEIENMLLAHFANSRSIAYSVAAAAVAAATHNCACNRKYIYTQACVCVCICIYFLHANTSDILNAGSEAIRPAK